MSGDERPADAAPDPGGVGETRPQLEGEALRRAVGVESSDAAAPRSTGGPPAARGWRAWAPWVAMAAIVLVALLVGTTRDDGPATNAERVYALARTIACPTCVGQSVAESDISVSREIRREIATRVEAGQTDDEIRAYFADRFGEEVLLTPSSQGATGLVWVLPVVAGVAALAGLVAVFWRWRSRPGSAASDADRALVEAALRSGPSGGGDGDGGADDDGARP